MLELATGPGVQRKAPRTVIQRENKPKGPRLEEQHEEGRRERSQQLIPASKDFSLMHLVTRVHWENNQPRKYDMTLYLIDTTANNVVVSTHKTFFAAVTRRHDLAKFENRRGFGGLEVVELQAQENVMQLTNALQSGDWGSGARAIAQLGAGAGASAKSLAAALIPAGLLAGVIGGLGYAYFDAMKQAREFNSVINGGSNDAGQSVASLKSMSDSAGTLTGNLAGAREAVIALASGAATSGVQMQNLAEAAAAIGEVTGKGAGDIATSLANAGNTATEAASKISDQYGLLTYEQYQVIKAIDEQGDHQLALDTLSENLNQSAQERLKNYRDSLSDI
ncbi:phage tail length tape measure family protein, partial [Pseudomonas protegens]|uniref:phage tail length tape measure family protein n=1 Tax=Pseudomonas protegens TaxID=380021 RepID=UPI00223AF13C